MKKSELNEIKKIINEATYIGKTVDNQLNSLHKKALKPWLSGVLIGIEDSPDYDSTKNESDEAMRDVKMALEKFMADVQKAIKPIEKNIA